MSTRARYRKSQLRAFQRRLKWNDGPDRVLGDWKIIDNHDLSFKPDALSSFDFWASNGKGVHILRLTQSDKSTFSIFKDNSSNAVTYLTAECPFDQVTNELISRVLLAFEQYGIPLWRSGPFYSTFEP